MKQNFKTFKLLTAVAVTLFLSINFISCDKDGDNPGELGGQVIDNVDLSNVKLVESMLIGKWQLIKTEVKKYKSQVWENTDIGAGGSGQHGLHFNQLEFYKGSDYNRYTCYYTEKSGRWDYIEKGRFSSDFNYVDFRSLMILEIIKLGSHSMIGVFTPAGSGPREDLQKFRYTWKKVDKLPEIIKK